METKLKAIIIDDEKLGREIIKNFLVDREDIELIGECSNGFEGIRAINERNPDLIFLDIQMPKLNGFEMLELIENPPIIIFTTAFDQYAIKAFEINATDYLLKPFSKERFDEAILKAKKQLINKEEYNSSIRSLISKLDKRQEYLERIVVKTNNKILLIPIDEINYLEAQDDYVMIHTTNGKFLKQKTMKYFEENLNPKEFLRIHRSFIVRLKNIKQIELYEKDSHIVILNDSTKLPVSKSGYQKLKEIL
ncbi:LytR/AlgR family response regulator transcription factor [Melioribacteraceae bacterium 4301-Me]|uniref:LytR/AlgR family response regulator transcription factor n=1 Tax=Pyranulibacter aquaticus TaxID=3163344 RepID=UPI0035978AD0